MEEARERHICEDDWRRECVRRYRPKTWRQLKMIHAKSVEWWEEKIKISGVGQGSKGTMNSRGQSLKSAHRVKTAKGCRSAGGGRKDEFRVFKDGLKLWVGAERENGHPLDGGDLLEQFQWMAEACVATSTASKLKGSS